MEKLLHERLREYDEATRQCTFSFLTGKEHCEDNLSCINCTEQALNELADEIERYYIPRPRFEDGTPLKNGDEIEYYGRAEKVVSYLVCGETREDVDYGAREPYATLHLKCGASHNVPLGEPLKRPTHKVYDADGVAYERGQHVWHIETGEEYIVIDLPTPDCYQSIQVESVESGYKTGYDPNRLTHEKPVFDADGVRICKGDTVWHVGDSSQGTVVDVTSANTWNGYPVKVAWDKGDEGFYQGDALTHREPDSIQKVVDDMDASLRGMKVCDLQGYIDRLTALIERGA